jgi:hypothetical protein
MEKQKRDQFGGAGGTPFGYGCANSLLSKIKEALGLDRAQVKRMELLRIWLSGYALVVVMLSVPLSLPLSLSLSLPFHFPFAFPFTFPFAFSLHFV